MTSFTTDLLGGEESDGLSVLLDGDAHLGEDSFSLVPDRFRPAEFFLPSFVQFCVRKKWRKSKQCCQMMFEFCTGYWSLWTEIQSSYFTHEVFVKLLVANTKLKSGFGQFRRCLLQITRFFSKISERFCVRVNYVRYESKKNSVLPIVFYVLPAHLIFVYIWLKISSVEGNLFIFGLVCYICPGSQKSTFWLPNINEYLTSRQYLEW